MFFIKPDMVVCITVMKALQLSSTCSQVRCSDQFISLRAVSKFSISHFGILNCSNLSLEGQVSLCFVSFLENRIMLWSDRPVTMLEIFWVLSCLLLKTKSIHISDKVVILVGSLIICTRFVSTLGVFDLFCHSSLY